MGFGGRGALEWRLWGLCAAVLKEARKQGSKGAGAAVSGPAPRPTPGTGPCVLLRGLLLGDACLAQCSAASSHVLCVSTATRRRGSPWRGGMCMHGGWLGGGDQ